MIKFFHALAVGGLLAALPVRAVYAPLPDQEQGKDLTVTVKGGISYDSNLFGAATGELDSAIFTLEPRLSYNRSLTDQTFMAVSYGLTMDYFENRPGDKLLDSHMGMVRLAHAFSKATTIDVTDVFMVSRNPESLLAGVPLNPDQSFSRNQLDGRFNTPLGQKITGNFKARSVYYEYRNAILGRSLDRIENLYGFSSDYAYLPEVKAVAEYRHQDVYYRKEGETKNKSSEFLMGGVDYAVAKKMSLSGRLGAEWRKRKAEQDTTSPSAEFTAKYDYTESSFFIGGYAFSLEETSDTTRFTDSKIHRMFVSVQHSLSALIVASGSATYEPSQLQGRRGITNVDERTARLGAALTYLPTKNWMISGSLDYDRVRSDDAARNMLRKRAALNAIYSF